MCFKSIYKNLKEDFRFVSEYGYLYMHNGYHHVHPYVVFGNENSKVVIGFMYDEDCFRASWCDISVKRKTPIETIKKIEEIAKTNPREADEMRKMVDSFNACTDILEGHILLGKKYKEQVEQVKKIVRDYLYEKN